MIDPLPLTYPYYVSKYVTVETDAAGKILVNFAQYSKLDADMCSDPTWVLDNWWNIHDESKPTAAQYLFSKGVEKKDIPEYRTHYWRRCVATTGTYKCGCPCNNREEEVLDKMPDDFEEIIVEGDWYHIHHIGKVVERTEDNTVLCPSCSSVSLANVLQSISNLPQVTIGNSTYVALEEVEKDWHAYSKKWHSVYGPKVTVKSRIVAVLDHATLSMRVIRRLKRWPNGWKGGWSTGTAGRVLYDSKMVQAVVDALPFEDLPKVLGTNDDVDTAIKRRMERGS